MSIQNEPHMISIRRSMELHHMSKQIMVVDDEAYMLALTEIILKRRGFTVVKAQNAWDALDKLNSSTPDLFILDVMMPGIDGIELCKQLRARPQTANIPVIMFSAKDDVLSMERSLKAGANAYLSKLTRHTDLV